MSDSGPPRRLFEFKIPANLSGFETFIALFGLLTQNPWPSSYLFYRKNVLP